MVPPFVVGEASMRPRIGLTALALPVLVWLFAGARPFSPSSAPVSYTHLTLPTKA